MGRARDRLATWVAPEGLAAIREMTDRLDRMERSGSVLGVVLVIYASTRLFRALRRALNQLWGIDLEGIERARGRAKRHGVRYGGALLLTLFVAVLVVALIVVKMGFALIASMSTRAPPSLLWGLDVFISVGLAFVLFTALFATGSGLVTRYVRHKHMDAVYEGASAIVLAVLWVYYSAQVFFFGACVGAVLRQRFRPTRRADPGTRRCLSSTSSPPPA